MRSRSRVVRSDVERTRSRASVSVTASSTDAETSLLPGPQPVNL